MAKHLDLDEVFDLLGNCLASITSSTQEKSKPAAVSAAHRILTMVYHLLIRKQT
jgi:hypothetical protein